jgi:hypothetical protein
MPIAEIWFLSAPFAFLVALYCWDVGTDLLVP